MPDGLKYFGTYGVPKEKFINYNDIIQKGNDVSLGSIVVLDALVLSGFTAVKYIFDWPLEATAVYTIVEVLIALAYFLLAKVTEGYHYIFYYMTVEVLIVYGSYAMSYDSPGTIFLYPAVVVLLPLFLTLCRREVSETVRFR